MGSHGSRMLGLDPAFEGDIPKMSQSFEGLGLTLRIRLRKRESLMDFTCSYEDQCDLRRLNLSYHASKESELCHQGRDEIALFCRNCADVVMRMIGPVVLIECYASSSRMLGSYELQVHLCTCRTGLVSRNEQNGWMIDRLIIHPAPLCAD